MGMTWTDGNVGAIPVQWLRLTSTIQVNQNKELVTAMFKANGYQYFDNFSLKRNLSNERTVGNNILTIPISANVSEYPVFGALSDCYISAAHIFPKAQITGANPALVLTLKNTEDDSTICTKTFAAGTDAPAYEVTAFGPADEDHYEISTGYGVKLEVSGSGSIPDLLLLLEWNLL